MEEVLDVFRLAKRSGSRMRCFSHTAYSARLAGTGLLANSLHRLRALPGTAHAAYIRIKEQRWEFADLRAGVRLLGLEPLNIREVLEYFVLHGGPATSELISVRLMQSESEMR